MKMFGNVLGFVGINAYTFWDYVTIYAFYLAHSLDDTIFLLYDCLHIFACASKAAIADAYLVIPLRTS